MSDLNETLQRLAALQSMYETKQAELELEAGPEDLVAAIDIGSTFTRCAFSFRTEDDCLDLYVCNFRNPLTETKSNKSPTCLLLSGGEEVAWFGYGAQKAFVDLKDNSRGYMMFDQFFHVIHEEPSVTAATMVESNNGQGGKPALTLMTHLLAFLKKRVMQEAASKTDGKGHACACWVLTVPAMWDEDKKRFLRQAAVQAELIEDVDSRKLRVLTSEEAAFQYCSGLDSADFIGRPPPDKLAIQPGDRYLVVDVGGCSISATAYKLREGGASRELHGAMSCGHLGNHVDHVYAALLLKLFGADFIDYLRRDKAAIWHKVMSNFSDSKLKMTHETTGNVKIEFPSSFKTYYEKKEGVEIGDALKKSRISGIKYVEPNMWISADIIRSLYKRIIDFIIRYIRNMTENTALKDIKVIYMVGGFADSGVVRSALLREFEDIPVLIPTQPSQAVSMCAVLLALEPDASQH